MPEKENPTKSRVQETREEFIEALENLIQAQDPQVKKTLREIALDKLYDLVAADEASELQEIIRLKPQSKN